MSKTSGQTVKGAENRSQAIALRKDGSTYEEIGKTLGISGQRAHKIVTSELTRIREKTAEETDILRTLELQRLDSLFQTCYKQAQKGNMPAVDRCVRIMERRAKLLGLDMPTKIAPTGPDGNALDLSKWEAIRFNILQIIDPILTPESRAQIAAALIQVDLEEPREGP
jgi:hypothetical protein